MPRKKKNGVRKHFLSRNNTAQCKYCEKLFKNANVMRLETHLVQCYICPDEVKNSIADTLAEAGAARRESTSSVTISTESEPSDEEESIDQNKQITKEKKKILDQLISKAIFASGASISMLEHPLWIQFFQELQPIYSVPNRKAILTRHLNTIYNQINEEITVDLKSATNLHLLCDGWTNQEFEGIIKFLLAKPEPVFVKSLNTEANPNPSQYMFNEIAKVINVYGAPKFATLIGDNAPNTQKAFELIQKIYPHITPLRCVAHTLNLLCDDVLKPEVIKRCLKILIDVIKTIKESQVLNSLFTQIVKEKGFGQIPTLPDRTRWGIFCKALKSIKESKVALQILAFREADSLPVEDKEQILDEEIWNILDECIQLLQPICHKILRLEANAIKVNDVFLLFKDIESEFNLILPDLMLLSDTDKERVMNSVRARVRNCVKPIHYAAYMLDPKSVDQAFELTENEEIEAMQFISDMGDFLHLKVIGDLANYRSKDGFWGKSYIWQNVLHMTPVVWWKGICGSTTLSKVAVRLLTAPCTSAASERSSSVLVNINSAEGNQLTTKQAAKISFITYNWNKVSKNQEVLEDTYADKTITLNEPSTSYKDFEFCDADKMSRADTERDSN